MQATPSPDPTSTSTGTSTSTDTGTGTGTGTSTTITTSTGTSTSEAETIAICVKTVSGKIVALEVARLCDCGIQNRPTAYVILSLRGGGCEISRCCHGRPCPFWRRLGRRSLQDTMGSQETSILFPRGVYLSKALGLLIVWICCVHSTPRGRVRIFEHVGCDMLFADYDFFLYISGGVLHVFFCAHFLSLYCLSLIHCDFRKCWTVFALEAIWRKNSKAKSNREMNEYQ